MKLKVPAEAGRHIHRDDAVTVERLDRFADASRSTQLRVLAELRGRTVEDSIDLSLFAILLAIVVPFALVWAGPSPILGSALVKTIVIAVSVLLIVLTLLPLAWAPIVRGEKRRLATIWIAAYEDELERRSAQPGRAGRHWRATH